MNTEQTPTCSDRARHLRRIILRNTGRLFHAVFIKGDTPKMQKRGRRRPDRREMDFTLTNVRQPQDHGLMIVYDEGRQGYRHINLATCEHLLVVDDFGLVLEEWRADVRRNLKADRVVSPSTGRFVPRSSETRPLVKSYEEASAAVNALFN